MNHLVKIFGFDAGSLVEILLAETIVSDCFDLAEEVCDLEAGGAIITRTVGGS